MDERAVLTSGAHRAIRMLDAHESAYAGELITDGERRAVRVDAEAVAEQLWELAGAEHVAGVRDVLRRADGHDAVLPWCAERVEVFVGRRAAAQSALSAGETVTLVGSLLRGIVEVADRGVTGQWWLTDEARPVFAPGEGMGCAASAVALIARLREGCTDRAMTRVLDEISAAAGDQRIVRREIERFERELTELAAPRALVRDVLAPERVVTIGVHRAHLREESDLLAAEPSALHRVRDRVAATAQHVGHLLRSAVGRHGRRTAREAGRRREPVASEVGAARPTARAPRARVLVVGGAAAALVLVGGLMWPTADEDSAAIEGAAEATGAPASTGAADHAAEPPAGSAPAPDPGDAARAPTDAADERQPATVPAPDAVLDGSAQQHAAALLTAVLACADRGDRECTDAIVDGAGGAVLERLTGTDATRTISAVEDYGDVSVLRLGSSGERGEQMLVLVMQKDRWLVRDVYDVADQPSGQG